MSAKSFFSSRSSCFLLSLRPLSSTRAGTENHSPGASSLAEFTKVLLLVVLGLLCGRHEVSDIGAGIWLSDSEANALLSAENFRKDPAMDQ